MKKQDEQIVLWVVGIIILLLVVTQLPLPKFPFAIIQKVTCDNKVLSHFDLNGNVLDSNNLNNGVPYNISFELGKFGQAVKFDGTNTSYIDFPLILSENKTIIMWLKDYETDWSFASETNGISSYNNIIQIGPNFGSEFNGSVDEITIFSPALTSLELANYSLGRVACYTISYEENISCKDYATDLTEDQLTGCLSYSGEFFPSCDYEWLNISNYFIEDNECEKYFYCTNESEFETKQECIESLVYDCYLLENSNCVHKTDYESCTGDFYLNLTECQEDLPEPSTATTTTTTPPEETIKDKLNKEVFTLFGQEITLLHLFIVLIIIMGLLFFLRK